MPLALITNLEGPSQLELLATLLVLSVYRLAASGQASEILLAAVTLLPSAPSILDPVCQPVSSVSSQQLLDSVSGFFLFIISPYHRLRER